MAEPVETNIPEEVLSEESDLDSLMTSLAEPETPPAEPPVPVPQAVPSSTESAAQTPAPPPAAPPASAEPAASTPVPTPPPVQSPVAEMVENQLQELAKMYTLSEEDAKALLTEPEVVLPKLAANLHKQVLSAVQQAIYSQIPQLIDTVTQARQREYEAQNAFYSRWPQLRQHSDAVLRVAQLYRAANPTASSTEAIEQIGRIVSLSLGLQSPEPEPTKAPATYRPAGAQTASAPVPPKPKSPIDSFIEEDLSDL